MHRFKDQKRIELKELKKIVSEIKKYDSLRFFYNLFRSFPFSEWFFKKISNTEQKMISFLFSNEKYA